MICLTHDQVEAINLVEGMVSAGSFTAEGLDLQLKDHAFASAYDGPAWFGTCPEHVFLGHDANGAETSLDVWAEVVDPLGSDTLVLTRASCQRSWNRVSGKTTVKAGERTGIAISARNASFLDKTAIKRL